MNSGLYYIKKINKQVFICNNIKKRINVEKKYPGIAKIWLWELEELEENNRVLAKIIYSHYLNRNFKKII